ncbi:MAG: O-methyltransferase [Bacteroidetes bacterium]|jgi:predicted O-methyltransferase YrrM|nr:O-methyltransferase [Bacteroidota bacterium]
MDFWPPELVLYMEAHSGEEPALLGQLCRETHLKVNTPQMLSGHHQGQLLRLLSLLCKPRYILEIGTFTGYSSICLTQGMDDNGQLHSIEIDPERETMIKKYWALAGCRQQCHLHLGKAIDIIPTLPDGFDLVFIDADKVNYPHYLQQVYQKMRRGGLLLADNVLWSGKVVDDTAQDKDTDGLRQFNLLVQNHPGLLNVVLPIRDGIMAAIKIAD